jgi:hypothetical protein
VSPAAVISAVVGAIVLTATLAFAYGYHQASEPRTVRFEVQIPTGTLGP